ncbi:MAG: hydroxyacid dehydrogenase [Burkholderiaceae bacterium]|nr:hydroxyacid dehydrogenase [Burkholderiaceae bacterium]
MTRVFVSHPTTKLAQYFGDKASAALQAFAEVRYNTEPRELSTPELAAAAQGCEVIIAYRQTPGPEELFAALPDLIAFVRCAMDIRTIDVAAASRHGVLVTQASAGFVPAVSEWIIAVMVDLARGISRSTEAYHRGEPGQPRMGRELRGATLGVIGYGRIARYLCELARAFGMRIVVSDPRVVGEPGAPPQLSLAALLAQSDFVVCLAAAVPETEHLMNGAAFAAMKEGSFFINASRGELVDDAALLAALDSGHLAGCAIDVGQAPDQMPSPDVARHPGVIATPHIGGLTPEAVDHQALETVAQVQALVQGRLPAGAVNAASATRLQRWGHAVPASAA